MIQLKQCLFCKLIILLTRLFLWTRWFAKHVWIINLQTESANQLSISQLLICKWFVLLSQIFSMNHSVHKTGLNDCVHKSDWICSQFQLTDSMIQSQQCLISVWIIYLSQNFSENVSEWFINPVWMIHSQIRLNWFSISTYWLNDPFTVGSRNIISE